MDEKDNQVAHLFIITNPGDRLGLCHEIAIRHGQDSVQDIIGGNDQSADLLSKPG